MTLRHKKVFFFILFFSLNIFAEPPIIISADRIKSSMQRTSGTVSVITAKDIRAKNYQNIKEVLESVSGIHIVSNGTSGSTTNLFLRGGNSDSVLVLIDEIEANDPSSPNRQFDFGHLTLQDISKIEVLKGAQSVLYGSDAISGVILITTKSGSRKTTHTLNTSFDTLPSASLALSRKGRITKNTTYAITSEIIKSKGISSSNETSSNELEKDGRQFYNVTGKIKHFFSKTFYAFTSLRFLNDQVDLDKGSGAARDDINDEQITTQLYAQAGVNIITFDGQLESRFAINYTAHQRENRILSDSIHTASSANNFDGNIIKFSSQNNILLGKYHTTIIGLESETEEVTDLGTSSLAEQSATTLSTYLNHKYADDFFFLSLGTRLDHHDQFESHFSYKLSPGIFIDDYKLKLYTSLTTGMKSPSLFELYDSTFGNNGLSPEKSINIDIGFTKEILERGEITLVYFQNKISNEISFDLTNSKYLNSGESEMKGIETVFKWHEQDWYTFVFNYTFTFARDETTRLLLLRRPKNQASASLFYNLSTNLTIDIGLQFIGEREDLDPASFARTTNPEYLTLSLGTSYNIKKNIKMWFKIENILNKKYEEIKGFSSRGRTGRAGLNWIF